MKILIVIIMLTINPFAALSYEVNVHQKIADNAITASGVEQSLFNNMGILLNKDKFKDSSFFNMNAREWIEAGSDWEDNIVGTSEELRFMNHFFDPKTGSGLNFVGAASSLVWGKDHGNNLFNWYRTRQHYHWALTAPKKTDRDAAFARVFRALGQLIHLVHDLAVPAHVRNDPHFPYFNPIVNSKDMYEDYTREKVNNFTYAGYVPVDITTFNSFDKFWKNSGMGLAEYTNRTFVSRDTNLADSGYQPYQTPIPTGETVASETIAVLSTEGMDGAPKLVDIDVPVKYMKGESADYYVQQVAEIKRLTAFSIFDYDMNIFKSERVYSLNNLNHQEYASFLIPRAVGYSAGFLNYFFRGDINLEPSTTDPSKFVIKNNSNEDIAGKFEIYYDNSNNERSLLIGFNPMAISAHNKSMLITLNEPKDPSAYILVFKGKMGSEEGAVVGRVVKFSPLTISAPDRCLYGLIDGARLPQQFNKIKAKVKSSFTPEQAVQSGTLWAVAKYKRRMDYQPNLSTDPPSPGVIDPVFAYSTSAPIPITAADLTAMNATKEFAFNFSGSPIPAGITDLYLKVVFRGATGTPQDVIAMGWKDLGEPMHHVYWNATDAFYIEGKMYDKNTIEANQNLLDKAQKSGFPYGPLELDTDIAYCPDLEGVSKTHVEYKALKAGTFGRVITITEADQPEYDVFIHRKSTTPFEEMSSLFTSPTVVNQTNQNGVLQIFPVFTFRGSSLHAGSAFVNCAGACPENIVTLPWPNPPLSITPKPATFIEQ